MKKLEINSIDYNKVDLILSTAKDKNIKICDTFCIALQKAGYFLQQGMFDSPSLNLLDYLKNEEVDKIYKNYSSLLYKDYKMNLPNSFKPWEVCEVLYKGINSWLGQDIISFSKDINIDLIVNNVIKNTPVILIKNKLNENQSKDDSNLIIVFGVIFKSNVDIFDTLDIASYVNKLLVLDLDNLSNKEIDINSLLTYYKPFNNKYKKWGFLIKNPPETI